MSTTAENLDGAQDVLQLATALREALTDSMVERLTDTAANTLEVVNKLNDPDTQEAVIHLIDRLTELKQSGALDTLFDLVQLIHGSRMALTDSMVDRLFSFIEHMINNMGTEEMATLVNNTSCAMTEAAEETMDQKPSGGLFSTLSMLSKPETQKTLQFLLAFGGKLQQSTVESDS